MGAIGRFAKRYKGHLLHVWLEEYLGWLTRSLPGFEGMLLRYFVYRILFKKIESLCLIYPGVYMTHTYGIQVGRRFSINTGSLLDGRGGITIGDGVMIGPNTVIVSSGHQHGQVDVPMTEIDHIMTPVLIEDDVWIGANCVIKGGVTLGKGTVVAAGAVVVGSLPAYSIAGGVPAKKIGDRRELAAKE